MAEWIKRIPDTIWYTVLGLSVCYLLIYRLKLHKYSELSHRNVLAIQLTLHRYTSAQSTLFLSKATCFD